MGGRGGSVSPIRAGALAVAAGASWGIFCWWGDSVAPPVAVLANLGGGWLLLAALLGAWGGRPGLGAVAGALALVAAVLAYYGSYEFAYAVDPDRDPRYFVPGGLAWLVVSTIAGAVAGAAGAVARSGRGRVAIAAGALIGAALVAEGLFLIARDLGPDGIASVRGLVVGGEVVLGLLLPLTIVKAADVRLLVGTTMVAGLAGIAVVDALREFLSVYRA